MQATAESSPRAWGCFCDSATPRLWAIVFPTGVGMFLCTVNERTLKTGLPHGRGDVSNSGVSTLTIYVSSPRAWGCFRSLCDCKMHGSVFPTGVGMFPRRGVHQSASAGLPHGRGDVSIEYVSILAQAQSSPRAWGCFYLKREQASSLIVFPTGVGMFLRKLRLPSMKTSLPHGRGDVSNKPYTVTLTVLSSPRAWGCF